MLIFADHSKDYFVCPVVLVSLRLCVLVSVHSGYSVVRNPGIKCSYETEEKMGIHLYIYSYIYYIYTHSLNLCTKVLLVEMDAEEGLSDLVKRRSHDPVPYPLLGCYLG